MAHSRERQGHHQSRRRSRSPDRHQSKSDRKRSKSPPNRPLPFNARALSKHDLDKYRPLFALYLDLQKQLDIDELSVDEVKGRWKSFIGKWNRGQLAEGYYDPVAKQKADRSQAQEVPPTRDEVRLSDVARQEVNEDDDEDEYGPSLPGQGTRSERFGPTVPRHDDLQQRREMAEEDEESRREDLRYARKQDRKAQKERFEEMAPRAEPGTKERQLEKKQEKSAANRSFREAKSPGAEEVGENDLLGGDEGLEGYKARLKAGEKKRSERELRKEEALRARAAEREERLGVHRAKEAKTMEMLQSLAKQRYG